MNDDMILKDNGVINNSEINVIRNACIEVKLEVKKWMHQTEIIQRIIFATDFKIIKSNENKEVDVCNNNYSINNFLS